MALFSPVDRNRLERAGVLAVVRIAGVHATRSYAVDPGVLRAMSAA